MNSVAVVSGTFMIIGALCGFLGHIYWAVLSYTVVDACCILFAIQDGGWFGVIAVTIGFVLNVAVFLKMHTGVFYKYLKINQESNDDSSSTN